MDPEVSPRLGENMKTMIEDKEGTIIDVKKYGKWLIVSYKGKWGISFRKLRIDESKIGEGK